MKINPQSEGTAIVTQGFGSILSFSALTKCRQTGTASRSSRENDYRLSSEASARLSWEPREPVPRASHSGSRWRVSNTPRRVYSNDIAGSLDTAWVFGDTCAHHHLCPVVCRARLPPSLLWAVAQGAAGEMLPSHSSEKLLTCCGVTILSFHLHLNYRFVPWYIASIWKCSQKFQSLIFILCQNRIPDWSNIIFWLMCFRKLVTDPELYLLVDDSAGENTAEIIFCNNLEHAQIISMMQILELSSLLQNFHGVSAFTVVLPWRFLPSSFQLAGESSGRGEKVRETLEQEV